MRLPMWMLIAGLLVCPLQGLAGGTDDDGDGFSVPEDCDDTDPAINPGAAEICDGVDNDCNSLIDDDDPGVIDAQTFWTDADSDTFGDPAQPVMACMMPPGTADNDLDCDDTDAAINPGANEVCDGVDNDCDSLVDDDDDSVTGQTTFYTDADSDAFGNPALPVLACQMPGGTANNNLDCDDANAAINPGATEVCDSIDNDCDSLVDDDDDSVSGQTTFYTDADGDAFGNPTLPVQACQMPEGTAGNNLDCDDTDPAINPAADEVCDSGTDNDCDGLIDAGDDSVVDAIRFCRDADGDGFGDPASMVLACDPPMGFVLECSDCDDTDPGIGGGCGLIYADGFESMMTKVLPCSGR